MANGESEVVVETGSEERDEVLRDKGGVVENFLLFGCETFKVWWFHVVFHRLKSSEDI